MGCLLATPKHPRPPAARRQDPRLRRVRREPVLVRARHLQPRQGAPRRPPRRRPGVAAPGGVPQQLSRSRSHRSAEHPQRGREDPQGIRSPPSGDRRPQRRTWSRRAQGAARRDLRRARPSPRASARRPRALTRRAVCPASQQGRRPFRYRNAEQQGYGRQPLETAPCCTELVSTPRGFLHIPLSESGQIITVSASFAQVSFGPFNVWL